MFDYAIARRAMIDGQIRVNDVNDSRILHAFSQIPREVFISQAQTSLAYSDRVLKITDNQFLMRPRDFAKMLNALELKPTDIALDIGCGRGYSTAILSVLCETVLGLEEQQALVLHADKALEKCAIVNTVVLCNSFQKGAPSSGPFDIIFVGGAVREVPQEWIEQLAPNGRMVVAISQNAHTNLCRLMCYKKNDGKIEKQTICDADIPYLAGFSPKLQFEL